MIRSKILVALLICATFSFSQNQKYADGKELITAMHKAYSPNKWYKYFSFSQNMEFYRNDSVIKKDTWHEAYMPGSLIIKFGSKKSKDGVLFRDSKVYSFREGKDPMIFPRVHDLLLVGLDVYFYEPAKTIKILDSLGYDLTKIREDEFEGRKVFVVGADKNDNTTKQFWIDAERLYLHRIVYGKKDKITDCTFGEYVKLKGNWAAKTITFKQNGKLDLIERYYDMKFPKTLKEDWFDPKKFNEVELK